MTGTEHEVVWITDADGTMHATMEAERSKFGNAVVYDDYSGVATLCDDEIDPDDIEGWSTTEPFGKTVWMCTECGIAARGDRDD